MTFLTEHFMKSVLLRFLVANDMMIRTKFILKEIFIRVFVFIIQFIVPEEIRLLIAENFPLFKFNNIFPYSQHFTSKCNSIYTTFKFQNSVSLLFMYRSYELGHVKALRCDREAYTNNYRQC